MARLAHALRETGVGVGERVAGLMPNMPETVVAMLAATSPGAIWSLCSPDFGRAGVFDRFGQIEPNDGYHYNGKSHGSLDVVADVRVILCVMLKPGLELDADLLARIQRRIRENTTPRHVPASILAVADIPYTLSGKKVELALRQVIHGQEVKNRDALANPQARACFSGLKELEARSYA